MKRREFTVLPLAHDLHKCSRCGWRLREGEQAVAYRGEGSVEFQHAGECPTLEPMQHPERRVIQGAKR